MLTNYIRIAFRHLRKNKLYATINAAGLSLGIVCVMLAMLYMLDERKYDRFHAQNPHLYRITTSTITAPGAKPQLVGATGQVQGPAFQAQVPEIVHAARVMGGDITGDFIAGGKTLRRQVLFTDPAFFNVFSFDVLSGNAATALTDVGSAVITESTARQLFGGTDVVGRQLGMDADPSAKRLAKPLVIAAVVKDPPRHSSLRFDVLLPFSFLQLSFEDNYWLSAYLGTFVVLQPGASPHAVAQKFDRIHTSLAAGQVADIRKRGEFAPQVTYGLQPVTDMHLYPLYHPDGSREGGTVNGSNPVFSRIFLGIAVFILLMAGINFVNISTGTSLRRAREIGVRKVNGGSSIQVVYQFLTESALLCTAAFVMALIVLPLILPVFNQLTGKDILISEIYSVPLLLWCVLTLIVVILLTGLYPALVLAGFKPVQALYGRQKLSGKNMTGRSLVVLQFSLAVFFVMATLLFYRQMQYVRTKDLGYNPQQVVRSNIPGDRDAQQVQALLRSELAKEPGISHVAFGSDLGGAAPVKFAGGSLKAIHKSIDEHYLPALGIRLKEGRNITAADANGVIVNEAFVKSAGLQQPLGAVVYADENRDKSPKVIVGVVKDYHTGSLRERILPVLMLRSEHKGSIWVRFEKNRQPQALQAFEQAYRKALPNAAMQYQYLGELNAKEYLQELRWEKVVRIAALLSIAICCLGLFGLAHLAIHQRMKEIGIRKVLGATVGDITITLSKDFLKPVLVAFLITVPLAWRAMHGWLQHFAYRVDVSWWIFAAAGAFALLAALAAVCSQTLRAAMASPLKSLQTD